MERILRGVNIGGCCMQLVKGAVEVTSTGGVQAVTGAALSGLALRKTPKAQREIAERMVTAVETHLHASTAPHDVQKQVVLILDRFTPTHKDIANGDMHAATIARQMRARVLAETNVADYRAAPVLDAYEALLGATLNPLCVPQTQNAANQQRMMADLTALKDAMLTQGIDKPLRDAGISEAVIIDLARRASGSTDSLQQAWTDLNAFFEAQLAVQQDSAPGNHADFLDEVIAQPAI